jgi:hypothetical protein
MSKVKVPFALLALAALSFAARPLAAAEPSCQRWDVEVTCSTNPSRVIVTDPFTATVRVKNTGDVALANVTLEVRGDLGAKTADGKPSVKTILPKLEVGETQEISAVFSCDTVGITRILGGARDSLGWAAANCACTVDVIGLPAVQSEMSDKDLDGKEKGIFVVGESYQYVLEIQNDAGTTVTPDLRVEFTLPAELQFVGGSGDHEIKVTGEGQSATTTGFVLAPNDRARIAITVKVVAAPDKNLTKVQAVIKTAGGVEIAEESESTTLKNAPGVKPTNP